MGKYRVLRFEFPASSSPNFEFPASENSAMSAENSDTKTDSSCPLAGNSAMSAENSDIKTDSRWVNIEFPASSSLHFEFSAVENSECLRKLQSDEIFDIGDWGL